MTIIRRRRDQTFTTVPSAIFDDARLSLPAVGLYCWLADEARTVEAALTRFGINRTQLAFLLEQLRAVDLVEAEDSGS